MVDGKSFFNALASGLVVKYFLLGKLFEGACVALLLSRTVSKFVR